MSSSSIRTASPDDLPAILVLVGRLMVLRLLDDARAVGAYKAQLLSHKGHADDGAHAFYRSLGFEPEAEGLRFHLGDG